MLYNLIGNAVNYTGEDKVVRIRLKKESDAIRFEVSDSGKGIKEEELEGIWDRYYRVDKVHRRAVIGTGLGLSIVKGVLELHNAAYGVENEEAGGATFWFELDLSTPIISEETIKDQTEE